MGTQARYASFPEAVLRERIDRARALMSEHKLDACLMVALEHLYYFGGYDCWVGVNSPQALVVTRAETSLTLIVRDVDLSLARETSFVGDIRTYRLNAESFPERVKEILAEKGVRTGRVGVESQSYAVTYALGKGLADALAPMTLADTTDLLGSLRVIKSPAEMALMQEAGRCANAGLAAMRAALKPGITEVALSAAIEAALRKAGSDYWSIPIELTSGHRSAGGHGTAREKPIEPGDLVHAEFAGVARRYHATAIQTLGVGNPGRRERDLYRLGIASLKAGVAACRNGAVASDVEEASLEPLRKEGLEAAAMMRFGYGLGIAYPPIWLEPLTIGRGFSTRLVPGMTFVLHSCIELPDEGLGVIQGGTYGIDAGGDLTMLAGAGDVDLICAG